MSAQITGRASLIDADGRNLFKAVHRGRCTGRDCGSPAVGRRLANFRSLIARRLATVGAGGRHAGERRERTNESWRRDAAASQLLPAQASLDSWRAMIDGSLSLAKRKFAFVLTRTLSSATGVIAAGSARGSTGTVLKAGWEPARHQLHATHYSVVGDDRKVETIEIPASGRMPPHPQTRQRRRKTCNGAEQHHFPVASEAGLTELIADFGALRQPNIK